MPPSRARYSVCTSVLLASRFMQMTLTTNRETTVAGMQRSKSAVSSRSLRSQAARLGEDGRVVAWIMEYLPTKKAVSQNAKPLPPQPSRK